jgi:hypothetical protein
MRSFSKSIVIGAVILLLIGCSAKQRPVQLIVPVSKIPVLNPPKVSADITGFKRLPAGKRTITVGKPFGMYFPGQRFQELLFRDQALKVYRDSLQEQIERHNHSIEAWRKDMKRLQK